MQAEDISNNPELVRRLDHLVREHPDFEVVSESAVDLYAFRYVPNGLAAHQNEPDVQQLLDRLNKEIVEHARSECFAQLTMVQALGRVALRIAICAGSTTREDIDATFDAIARWGWLCNKKYSSSVVI